MVTIVPMGRFNARPYSSCLVARLFPRKPLTVRAEGRSVLTIGLTTPSRPHLAIVYRKLGTRKVWRGLLLGMFLLVGLSLALYFILQAHGDLDDGNDSHPRPSSHINVVHSGIRSPQPANERVAPDAASAQTTTTDGRAPRTFDEPPAHALFAAAYASILSARGPPAPVTA
jgi:hypothetical protein